VASNVAQGLQLSGDLTGIDMAQLLKRLSGDAVSSFGTGTGTVVPVDGENA
jgi:flotillin